MHIHAFENTCGSMLCVCFFVLVHDICVFLCVQHSRMRGSPEIKADSTATEKSGISLIVQSDKDYPAGVCPPRLMSQQ